MKPQMPQSQFDMCSMSQPRRSPWIFAGQRAGAGNTIQADRMALSMLRRRQRAAKPAVLTLFGTGLRFLGWLGRDGQPRIPRDRFDTQLGYADLLHIIA